MSLVQWLIWRRPQCTVAVFFTACRFSFSDLVKTAFVQPTGHTTCQHAKKTQENTKKHQKTPINWGHPSQPHKPDKFLLRGKYRQENWGKEE
jgi:hypothetical protein